MNRRRFLAHSAALALAFPAARAQSAAPLSKMGLVSFTLGIHQKATQPNDALDYNDPLGFLEACRKVGAGGMQFALGVRDDAEARRLRKTAEGYGLFVEAIVPLPKAARDVERFASQIHTAKTSGAEIVRTVMLPGRRYEQFKSLEEFQQACQSGLAALRLAEPVAARHGVRLAVENHKDHRSAEKIAVLKQLSSEYVGLCLDLANNFALLEDPLETVRALAPWALTVHIKDLAIQEYAEGFQIADVALGAGFLDLPALVAILRQTRPQARFNLEVITRDPLKIPVLTPQYRATMPEIASSAVTRAMAFAQTRRNPALLTTVSQLSPGAQLALEQHNIERSLSYARDVLKL